MTYRKFKADYLFTGVEMAPAGSVLVSSEDGTIQDIVPATEAGDEIERLEGILSPGFVNCHCHLELSHMRGNLPEMTGLVDFLLAVITRRGQSATPETIASAIAAAEQEMLDRGIVAVGDICNTAATIHQKTQGRLFYHNFIETMGFVGATAKDRFAQSLQVFNAFAEAYPYPGETNSLVPHAPYSVSPELFRLVANFPGNRLLTIHNQESEDENRFFLDGQGEFLRLYKALGVDTSFFTGTGKHSLPSYMPYFYRNQTLILVHNVVTTREDLPEAGGHPKLHVCVCPNANLYITGKLPDIEMLAASGHSIVLGTDSLASNHQLDILEEAKTLQMHFPALSTETILRWATSGGAKALELDTVIGTFEKGKTPGLVQITGVDDGRLGALARAQRIL